MSRPEEYYIEEADPRVGQYIIDLEKQIAVKDALINRECIWYRIKINVNVFQPSCTTDPSDAIMNYRLPKYCRYCGGKVKHLEGSDE